MLELFSQRARQLIFLARFKAGQRGAAAIEIEDLLVAFIIEDQGEFENAVSSLFPNGKPVVQPGGQPHRPFLPPELASGLLPRVQALCAQSQPLPKESDMPLSEDGKAILRLADKLGSNFNKVPLNRCTCWQRFWRTSPAAPPNSSGRLESRAKR